MKSYVQYKGFSKDNPVKVYYRNGRTAVGLMERIVVSKGSLGTAEIMEIRATDSDAIIRAPLSRIKPVEEVK